ncbi:uncharacterized protein N7496_003398 [Penicillium cataractarum]|uniref:Uncharacterized protein n=1 Tax=Penicillium cataractarum TaxID=2100454 RepID=A0A9W9SMZ3_9EURO|nr:uncharacterized protein N7496_003398 [Penicillium cataractarum]KAJ5380970.1 hypothetical protein N7496_003398 [Penicillium cataractarum]
MAITRACKPADLGYCSRSLGGSELIMLLGPLLYNSANAPRNPSFVAEARGQDGGLGTHKTQDCLV